MSDDSDRRHNTPADRRSAKGAHDRVDAHEAACLEKYNKLVSSQEELAKTQAQTLEVILTLREEIKPVLAIMNAGKVNLKMLAILALIATTITVCIGAARAVFSTLSGGN